MWGAGIPDREKPMGARTPISESAASPLGPQLTIIGGDDRLAGAKPLFAQSAARDWKCP